MRDRLLYCGLGVALIGIGLRKCARNLTMPHEEKDTTIGNNHYRDTITRLEGFGNLCLQGRHRFVGGILPLKYHFEDGTFVLDTQVRFDFEKREMFLTNTTPLTLNRSDGTVRDIDIIDLSTDKRRKRVMKQELKNMRIEAQKRGLPQPHIGLESAFFPGGRKRKGKLQFVTADEVDTQGNHYLAFDEHRVKIQPRSLEPWRVVLEDGTFFTMLDPYAQILRYRIRVPSDIKPKDKKSNSFRAQKELARQFILAGYRQGINYHEIHREWIMYINKFLHKQSLLTKGKAIMTNVFWSTFGTAIAHGKGFLKPLSTRTTIFKG